MHDFFKYLNWTPANCFCIFHAILICNTPWQTLIVCISVNFLFLYTKYFWTFFHCFLVFCINRIVLGQEAYTGLPPEKRKHTRASFASAFELSGCHIERKRSLWRNPGSEPFIQFGVSPDRTLGRYLPRCHSFAKLHVRVEWLTKFVTPKFRLFFCFFLVYIFFF